MEMIHLCQSYLHFDLPSITLQKRSSKFRKKYDDYVTQLYCTPILVPILHSLSLCSVS